MNNKRKVPELSLMSYIEGSGADRVTFSNELYRGLRDYGFIILIDHPVDQSLISKAYNVVHEFFQLPLSAKSKYIYQNGGGLRGYTPFGIEHAKDCKIADLKEFWHVGRETLADENLKAFFPDNIWPKEISEFKKTMLEIYEGMDVTSQLIMDALGVALDVEPDYFANMLQDGNSILRAIHYPPIPDESSPGAVRAAAHEDINLITCMVGATASGLELLDRTGEWLPVNCNEKQLVIDSGDMLSRITNDVIPSTTHRVVNPSNHNETRYSIPYFTHPNPNAILSCIPSCRGKKEKYAPIKANDWLMQRLIDIGLLKK